MSYSKPNNFGIYETHEARRGARLLLIDMLTGEHFVNINQLGGATKMAAENVADAKIGLDGCRATDQHSATPHRAATPDQVSARRALALTQARVLGPLALEPDQLPAPDMHRLADVTDAVWNRMSVAQHFDALSSEIHP